MTWEILAALITILGSLVTLGTIVVKVTNKLTQQLTALDDTLKNLKAALDEFKATNKESHSRIYGRLDEHDEQLKDHETRIHDLERK